jgi:hypothetical protein
LISLALLNLIVVVAELLDHAFHVVPTPTPEPIPRLRPRPLLRVA